MSDLSNKDVFNQQGEELKGLNSPQNDELATANIIVAGITGSGKSTLINSVFGTDKARTGTGRPITEEVMDYSEPDSHVRIWDTVGLELDSEKTKKSIDAIRNKIAEMRNPHDKFSGIHAIWYCIQSTSNRYQGEELKFIKELHSLGVPFIIVITKCIGDEDDELEKQIRKINIENGMTDIEVVQVLAKKYKTPLGPIPSFGLENLVNTTLDKLPQFIETSFIAAQKIDASSKRTLSEKVIIDFVCNSINDPWDNMIIVNVFTSSVKTKKMFHKIGRIYNQYIMADDLNGIIDLYKADMGPISEALLNPFPTFKKKVDKILQDKQQEEGFSKDSIKLEDSKRTAQLLAYYGYIFVKAVNDLWEEQVKNECEELQIEIKALRRAISNYLKNGGVKPNGEQ